MKPLRILAVVLIAIVLLVIAVPVVVLTVIDGDDVKEFVAARIADQTGRKVEFSGPVDIGFWPKLRLETGAVSFANAAGFGDEPMLSVREFHIALDTLPLLLHRRVALDTIRLHGLRVQLARDASGRGNFDDLLGGESEPARFNLAGMALGGIDIQDAMITWEDATTGAERTATIRDFNATTGAFIVGEPIALKLGFTGTATRPALDGDVALTGTLDVDAGKQRYQVDDLALRATLRGANLPDRRADIELRAAIDGDLDAGTTRIRDLKLTGLGTDATGTIEIDGDTGARGELRLAGSDLALLFRVAELAAAEQLQRSRDRSFALTTKFDMNTAKGSAAVPEFTLDLLGANLRGELTASQLDRGQPAVRGSVQASGPDLPALLAVLGQFQSTPDKPLLQIAGKLADARDKSFTGAAHFDADVAAGRIKLEQLDLRGLGYTVSGQLDAANINQSAGAISGKLALRGAPAGPLLGAFNPGLGEAITTLAVDTELSGTTGDLRFAPLAIKAQVAGDGAPLDLALSAGSARANLERGDVELGEIRIAGLGIDGTGELRASKLRDKPDVTGRIALRQFNLREVLHRLHQELPPMADANALTRVAFSAELKGSASEFALNDIVVTLDEANAKGKLAVRDFDRPAVAFDFAVDRLDLDRYLAPKPQGKAKAAPAPEAAAVAATELPVETLRKLQAKGELRIAALRLSGLQLSNVRATLDAGGGTIRIDPVAVDLYRGSYLGRIALDASGAVPRLDLQTELKDVDIAPLLADLGNSSAGSVAGSAAFSAALGGSGSDTARLRQSLAGSGSFMIRDGVYHGIDLPSVLRQTELMIRSKSFNLLRKEGDTPFQQLGGTLKVDGGIMRSDDFVMLTPGIRVDGRGVLYDLNTGAIDYKLEAGVDPTTATRNEQRYDLGGYSVPVSCRAAPPKSPEVSCLPDVSKIAQAVGTRVITNQVQRLLQGGKKDQPAETAPAEQQQQEQPKPAKELLRRGLENLLNR
jgi:AsmA protein